MGHGQRNPIRQQGAVDHTASGGCYKLPDFRAIGSRVMDVNYYGWTDCLTKESYPL